MEEEYLEEEIRSEGETEMEGTSEFIVIDENIGEPEYLEEGDEIQVAEDEQEQEQEQQHDAAVEEETIAEVEEEEIELPDVLTVGQETFTYSPEVKYIYAEAVNENNEIIIGEVPKFSCKFCDASFKRLDSLYKHHSVHKGKTVCPVCNAVFSRVAHRTRHMRLKHPDVEVIMTRKRSHVKDGKDVKLETTVQTSDAFNILTSM